MPEKGEIEQLGGSGQVWGWWDIAAGLWFVPGAPLLFMVAEFLTHDTGTTVAMVPVWILVEVGLLVMARRDQRRRDALKED